MLPVVLLTGVCHTTAGQWISSGSRATAMGISGVMLTGESAGGINQASLATHERPSCFLHCANRFLIPELSFGAFCLSLPAKPGTFAFSGACSGTAAFHEIQAGVLFGRSLGKFVRAGVGMHYLRMDSYTFRQSRQTVVPSFGVQVIAGKSLSMGMLIFNPAGMQYAPSSPRIIPVLFGAGIGYHADDNLLICLEYFKETNQKPLLSGGMEYLLHKLVTLRFGVAGGQYPRFSFGIGLQLSAIKADLSVVRHPLLGSSPAISLSGTL